MLLVSFDMCYDVLRHFLFLSHTFCVWLYLFPYNNIHAFPIAECCTGSVYKLATFCVLGLFRDDILSRVKSVCNYLILCVPGTVFCWVYIQLYVIL